jgi:dTDP-4-amino-4,6-dideoxygalactose transaminase
MDFERALAAFLAVDTARISCSGTAALIVALEALKRRSRRRTVIVPAYTCPLVPQAVAHVGLRVQLCDLAADRFDLDPGALADACNEETLAIIPTHLGGLVADLRPVLEVAERWGASVVEDAAQALGAVWCGRPVGTIGDIGVYSLSRGKGLTLYEGGFWVAHGDELHAAMAQAADELMPPRAGLELLRVVQLIGYRVLYNPVGLHFAYGIPLRRALAKNDYFRAVGDEARSAIPLHRVGRWRRRVGASALRRLASAIAANTRRGRARAARLGRIPGIRVVSELPETVGAWPFLMVLADSVEVRDRVLAHLWSAGLGVTRLFISDLTGYGHLGGVVPRTTMPRARSFADRCFTVSNSECLSDAEFERVLDVIRRSVSA